MRKLKLKNKKVVVAMSGGIDSSVAAALLQRAGFEVIGVFMKLVDVPRFREGKKVARKVAKNLKIPFLVLDLRKEFQKRIINEFLKEYRAGRTPNPCIVCNKEIKFGLLLEKVLALNADYVATGHYARLQKKKDDIHLLKGKDKEKDQSYFLWQLNQKQLKRILFPVGNYTKGQVRKLAKKFKLPIFEIPESQEICFIQTTLGEEDKFSSSPFAKARVNDFLARHIKPKPGPVVEQVHYGAKKIVGQHQGLWFYTIGQRKGIKLPGGPFYVLDKNLKKNFLIVTKNERDLFKKELITKNVNWIPGGKAKLPLKIKAKIRYRHKPSLATIYKIQNTKYKILFRSPQRAITPGQSVVFYKGQELLGGGIIC